uniref:C3H1-type domain-containing protein n=1 Tax=Glossina brevipalpis TaxID=37001 RepID=A0A1A9WUA2_9MUSC
MIINNTEALKSWLVVVLEPLCDADSSALARYVLALLKKDKPEKELKRVMIEQLDVFLTEETKSFVERLFEAISTEEYLKLPPPATAAKTEKDNEETTRDGVTATSDIDVHTVRSVGIDMATGSTTNVINQQESNHGAINNHESLKVTDATSTTTLTANSVYTDKNHTPPIEESKAKDVQISNNITAVTERTSSSIWPHHQSSSSQHNQSQQQQQPYSAHYNYHNPSSGKNEPAPSTIHNYPAGDGGGNSGGDHHHHHRSESPPTVGRSVVADKENQPRESRRRRASLRSRSRSRSRSNERFSRRSRSRDRRINEREKSQRQFRNKSPPVAGGCDNSRHERRRGGGGGGGSIGDRRRMMVNSSNIGGGGERKTNAISGGRSTNRSSNSPRSRSPSLDRGNKSKRSPSTGRGQLRGVVSCATSPESRHHHEPEKRQRCRDFDEKGYCVRGETCPWDHGVNPVVFEGLNNTALISMSLREYNPDAPDLWSRAGPPNTAMVGATTPGTLMANSATAGINPFTGTTRTGGVMMGGPGPVGFPQVTGPDKTGNGAADYVRTAAAAGFRAAAPMIPFPFNPAAVTTPLQRELIPIPVVDATGGAVSVGGDVNATLQAQGKRRFELEDSVAIAEGPPKRKIPAHSRLGPRVPSMQNCSLELRKVPRGLNTIAHLNNHFAKFGKIINIQISYDGDPEAAIVTFSTHAEANVAYRSTEAVLNNRFIKVFWHTSVDTPIAGDSQQTGGGRKNSQYHLNNVPAMPTPSADSAKTANISQNQAGATTTNISNNASIQDATTIANTTTNATTTTTAVVATHVPTPSLRLKNNVPPRPVGVANAIIRKKQEEQVKAVAQLANGLRKRKQELLQSYLKQMKSALDLVERCEPSDPQRGKTLETIKVLQGTIDRLRKEIAAEQEQMQAQIQNQQPIPPVKKTKEQQKKELLDIELELFAQQQEGNDTTAIQKRLEELQRSLGIAPGSTSSTAVTPTVHGSPNNMAKSTHYMAGGRNNARTRSSYPEGSTRVDRRPKTIVVTGFNSEEADSVLGHFKHFGEITKHDMDLEKPQLILSYATRINAEQAILRGKLFKDKRLQVVFAPVVQTPNVAPGYFNKMRAIASPVYKEAATAEVNKTSQPQEANTAAISSPNPSQYNSETEATATDTLPELRLEDEEEDEESEDRSWRR